MTCSVMLKNWCPQDFRNATFFFQRSEGHDIVRRDGEVWATPTTQAFSPAGSQVGPCVTGLWTPVAPMVLGKISTFMGKFQVVLLMFIKLGIKLFDFWPPQEAFLISCPVYVFGENSPTRCDKACIWMAPATAARRLPLLRHRWWRRAAKWWASKRKLRCSGERKPWWVWRETHEKPMGKPRKPMGLSS